MQRTFSFIKLILILGLGLLFSNSFSQDVTQIAENYQGSETKVNKILETKLDVSFSFQKQLLFGKAWLTVQAYNTPVKQIELDAKGLLFKKVEIHSRKKIKPLSYTAANQKLYITLDRLYTANEKYLLYIEYETKPPSSSTGWQPALHFINPHQTQHGTPTQIWTSGQPENNSSWFPTIDKPNQKIKQEISITVPARFSTLSNGKLIEQQNISGGMRKDTWKMDLPHAPYLFMLAVGEFNIVKDYWKGKEVSYYTEPQFSEGPDAIRNAFPNTPEAMSYFSSILGVDYPWNKYSQIKLRDFSGAMEHTTATCFNEDKQSSARELLDKNYEPGNIHELFHQWFGNYVTAESWANICLNESFADLSEIIWAEHKFGNDVAGDHLLKGMQAYFSNEDGWKKSLVRFNYKIPQEVFDGISYQKGGRILNMLRIYLGNVTFYKGLNLYLTRHANQTAEAHDLRLALEDASGQDLNWFFNQWFFGSGHPELDISYEFNENSKQNYVIIKQQQQGNLFKIPITIDTYQHSGKTSRTFWLSKQVDTIKFVSVEKPLLINVDAKKVLIAKKTDHKTLVQFAFQYANAPLFQDRYEAVEAAKYKQNEKTAREILLAALHDQFYSIRTQAINAIALNDIIYPDSLLSDMITIAQTDPNNSTRAAAINKIGNLKSKKYLGIFNNLMTDKSYLVKGEALNAIGMVDLQQQFELAKVNEAGSKGKLRQVILQSYIINGNDAQWEYIFVILIQMAILLFNMLLPDN